MTTHIIGELQEVEAAAVAATAAAPDLAALDGVRVRYLGKKGELTSVLRGLGSLSAEERPAVGKVANEVRDAVESAIARRQADLSAAALGARLVADAVDITLPGRRRAPGHQHLIDRVVREICDIFIGLGYRIAEGPDVELDYYNFTALNTPPDHPARNASDTFYVEDLSGDVASVAGESDVLLRTQTSPVQVRVMEKEKPPLFYVVPGRTYRRDVPDPSHTPMFHQIEGFAVAEG
ncbi:MAG TPA: phenylalanine--tRNA ligase subunit alpha, partial [Coriobacteriia bacterium]